MSDSESTDYESLSDHTSVDHPSDEREMADFVIDDYESSGDEPDEELSPVTKDKDARRAHKEKIQKLADERDAEHLRELEANKDKYIVRERRPRRAKQSAAQKFEEWEAQLEDLTHELEDVKGELAPLKNKRKRSDEEKEALEDLLDHQEILTDRIRILQENITSVEEANKTVWGDLEKMQKTAQKDHVTHQKRLGELEVMQAEYEEKPTVTLQKKIKKAETDVEKLRKKAEKSHVKFVKAEEDQKILMGELSVESSDDEGSSDGDEASDWAPSGSEEEPYSSSENSYGSDYTSDSE